MHHTAELVRSILRWAITILSADDVADKRIPGPRLSQFCLGQMMSRTDMQTSTAIAREIAAIERRGASDEYVESLIVCIRASWGATTPVRQRRGAREGSRMHADRLLEALRRFGTEEERRLLEIGSAATSWKKTELFLPGRVWQSVQDDFERIGKKFYLKESMTVDNAAEYVTSIVRR